MRDETAGEAEAEVDEVVRTWAPKVEPEPEPEPKVAVAAPDSWGNEPVARAAAGNDMAAAMALAIAALVDLGAEAEEAEAEATGMGDWASAGRRLGGTRCATDSDADSDVASALSSAFACGGCCDGAGCAGIGTGSG